MQEEPHLNYSHSINELTDRLPFPAKVSREWIVIGGTESGGIIVRKGPDLTSLQLAQRLRTGAIVWQLSSCRGRFHYKLARGQPAEMGPMEGWVSMKLGDKELLRVTATRGERRAWLEELLRVYAGMPYQMELHRAWDSASDLMEKANVRSELHLKVQHVLQAKFGRITPLDIFRSNATFRKEYRADAHEARLIAWIIWFCHPAAQVVHVLGPPDDARADEMWQILVDSNPYRLPGAKVVAMAPLKVCRACVRVFGALSGDMLCTFDVALEDRVWHLKTQISRLEGTCVHQQQLVKGEHRVVDMQVVRSLIGADQINHSECAFIDLVLLRHDAEKADTLRQLEQGDLNLWDLPSAWESENDFALAALKRSPLAIKFGPSKLRSNRAFMMVAVQLHGEVIEYAADDLLQDRALVLMAVETCGHALRFVSPSLRNDPEVVLTAVEQNALALEHASTKMQADRWIVLAAVERSGRALAFASPALQADPDIVLTALRQTATAVQHVSKKLQSNLSFFQRLQDSGLDPDGALLDHLLWVAPDTAHRWLEANSVIFVDARDEASFCCSRIEAAHSVSTLQISRWESKYWSEVPAFRLLLERPRLPIVVYSDHGFDPGLCGFVARILRQHGEISSHRVWRLEQGLNGWKMLGLPVKGDPRQMFGGRVLCEGEFDHKLNPELLGFQ